MYDRGIETFLAIVSCHSISGAAELLHITQSAVSHRLRELESQMGMVLIDRQKGLRRSDLTLAGEKFLPLAERWSQLWREIQQIKSNISYLVLKIGCVDSVNSYLMPILYMTLADNVPPLHLKIFCMRGVDLYEKIERRELDIAFVGTELHHPNVEISHFHREPMLVIRHRQRAASSRTVRAEDLDPGYEVYLPWSPLHRSWHDRVWNPARTPRIEIDTMSLLQSLMEDPRHWAIAPQSVMDHFNGKKKFIIQELDPPLLDRITLMITHRYPRVGALKGIEILVSVARKMGFLGNGNKDGLGRQQKGTKG